MIRITSSLDGEEGSALERLVTQRDVARRAGVSQAAASYALSGTSSRTSAVTRERVLKAAEELGYQPNLLARGLRGSSTGLLGIVVRDAAAPAAAEVYRALLRKAPTFGYDIVLTDAGDSARTLLRLANLMKSRLCEGLFLVGELPDQDVVWETYARIGLPTVAVLHGATECYPVPRVHADALAGLRAAVEHLVGLGHRSIGLVSTEWLHGVQERQAHLQVLLREYSQPVSPANIVITELSRDGGAIALEHLLRSATPPTAVLAATDLIAIGMLAEARRLGVRVPEDLSVVGFDDIPDAQVCFPTLTTVRQPFADMADRALEWFLARRSGTELAPERLALSTDLVVRESTGPPRALPGGAQRGRTTHNSIDKPSSIRPSATHGNVRRPC